LNPGFPAPQASVLIRTRLRAPETGLYKNEQIIINTLAKLRASGLDNGTLTQVEYQLKELNEKADINNPEEVKTYIANRKNKNGKETANSYKNNLIKAYAYFTVINNIQWKRPYFHYERVIPRIPTTESIKKIISASTRKYATIFTILAETGFEGKELERIPRSQINEEQGIINAQGCKHHNSRPIKLIQQTADMLRWYLQKYKDEYPFPRSDNYSRIWQRTRNKLAEKLNEPELKKIKLRHLRHYQATLFYDKTKDIIATKQRLGHKKIETTMLYTQLITFTENEEYNCKTATNIKEATELIEHGFQYITDIDGTKLFRKRK
jgi:integrase